MGEQAPQQRVVRRVGLRPRVRARSHGPAILRRRRAPRPSGCGPVYVKSFGGGGVRSYGVGSTSTVETPERDVEGSEAVAPGESAPTSGLQGGLVNAMLGRELEPSVPGPCRNRWARERSGALPGLRSAPAHAYNKPAPSRFLVSPAGKGARLRDL
jgi:hypothetical protein